MQELPLVVNKNPFLLDTVKVLVLKHILGETVVWHQFWALKLFNSAFDGLFLDILGIEKGEIESNSEDWDLFLISLSSSLKLLSSE